MSKKLKVGFTSYINSYPYLFPFRANALKAPFAIDVAPPRVLNRLLAEDHLDIALISPLEYNKGGYRFLAPLGIGAVEEILSVNLYIKEQEASCYPVHFTEESTSSIALLKILARDFWKKELVADVTAHNRLLIGDSALQNRHIDGYHTIDLAAEWFTATKKGFVFALLATKERTFEKYGEEIATALAALQEAVLWSQNNRGLIIEALPNYPPSLLERYFTACRYHLGEKERQGLEYFLELMACYYP